MGRGEAPRDDSRFSGLPILTVKTHPRPHGPGRGAANRFSVSNFRLRGRARGGGVYKENHWNIIDYESLEMIEITVIAIPIADREAGREMGRGEPPRNFFRFGLWTSSSCSWWGVYKKHDWKSFLFFQR